MVQEHMEYEESADRASLQGRHGCYYVCFQHQQHSPVVEAPFSVQVHPWGSVQVHPWGNYAWQGPGRGPECSACSLQYVHHVVLLLPRSCVCTPHLLANSVKLSFHAARSSSEVQQWPLRAFSATGLPPACTRPEKNFKQSATSMTLPCSVDTDHGTKLRHDRVLEADDTTCLLYVAPAKLTRRIH